VVDLISHSGGKGKKSKKDKSKKRENNSIAQKKNDVSGDGG